jgi:hypothetical protein
MPVEVRESHAAATATASGQPSGRVHPSVEAAIDDFETDQSPTSIDHIDTVRTGPDRIAITIIYTA